MKGAKRGRLGEIEGSGGDKRGFRVGISRRAVKRTTRRRSFSRRRGREKRGECLWEKSSQLGPRRAGTVRRRLHGAGHDEKTVIT